MNKKEKEIKAWAIIDHDESDKKKEKPYILFSSDKEKVFTPLEVFDFRHKKYALAYKKSWGYKGGHPKAVVVPVIITIVKK